MKTSKSVSETIDLGILGVPLCQCLNCHEVLIDTNPQVNSKLYDVSKAALNELVMSEDVEGYFKGCPNCMTDGYLTDNPTALQ